MLYVLRAGCLWRNLHERFGKWHSVYVRFRRWAEQGVWDALLQTLVELGLTDNLRHMLGSAVMRAHSQATDSLLMLPVPNPRAMLPDRGNDSDCSRQALLIHGILPVIPSREGRNAP